MRPPLPPSHTHTPADDRQLYYYFSNWKMTAALSYKAITSTYIGEHSLWCCFASCSMLDTSFWTIYNLKYYILFNKHLFTSYHVLGTRLDIAHKQMLCIVLALKQLAALTLVRVVEWILERIPIWIIKITKERNSWQKAWFPTWNLY